MISTVFLCLGATALLLPTSVYPVDLPPSCVKMCDKYKRSGSVSAYSLKCEDYPDDKDCMENCPECKDICTDDSPKKVYSCPRTPNAKKASKSFEGNHESNNTTLGIIFWVIGILVVVIILIIVVVWYVKRRNKNGLLMGGVGVRPAYPVLSQQDEQQATAIDFENPTTPQVPPIPSEHPSQTGSTRGVV